MPVRLFKKKVNRLIGILLFVMAIATSIFLLNKQNPINQHSAKDKRRLQTLIHTLNSCYWKNPRYYISLANEAIEISGKTKDSINLSKALYEKALCFQLIENSDSALSYFMQSLKVTDNIHNDSLSIKIKNGIANYYLGKEDYIEATTYLTEALKTAEKLEDKHIMGLLFNGLGIVNISLKEYDKAIKYFEQAKALCKEFGDVHNEAGIDMNIANCYFEKKDFKKAQNYYQNILQTFFKLKDSSQIILAYTNLGNISSNLNNAKKAFYYFNQAIELLRSYKSKSYLSTTYLEIGSLYYKLGNNSMARKYMELCLQNSSGSIAKSNSMQALQHLSFIEEKEGNSSMAFHYFKQYISIKDSIMNDETHKKIAEIQWKYDLNKKEYENELLQKKYEIKKRQNTIITLASASVILIVLLLSGLIILANRNLKKSVKLKELDNNILQEKIKTDEKISALEKFRYQTEIESKNKEMTTTSLQLAAKNEILSNILNSLDKINEAKSIDKESYKELRKTIEKNLNLDNDWDQFKELFDKVHNNFFISIKQICPKLSETELRFCAYLRINIQNKEIAKMLNISTETVKTTRYRIRKKLNLDNKTNLEDYIRNI